MANTRWRSVQLREALVFATGKTIAREWGVGDIETVEFTDGSAIRVCTDCHVWSDRSQEHNVRVEVFDG